MTGSKEKTEISYGILYHLKKQAKLKNTLLLLIQEPLAGPYY